MSISGSHKFAIAKSNKRKKQNSVIMPRGLPENKMACPVNIRIFINLLNLVNIIAFGMNTSRLG